MFNQSNPVEMQINIHELNFAVGSLSSYYSIEKKGKGL